MRKRKFEITIRLDGFTGSLRRTIVALDRDAAAVASRIWLEESPAEIVTADVGEVEEGSS